VRLPQLRVCRLYYLGEVVVNLKAKAGTGRKWSNRRDPYGW
jgi:hypothetical protein